jgi:pimeloyl-ACP methyl ester carboxylesterase
VISALRGQGKGLPKQRNKPRSRSAPHRKPTAFERAWENARTPSEPPPTVSGRWLLKAVAISIAGAAFCCWAALCLLFWQGSWQLLYHPASAITRSPAGAGIHFDPVAFATTDTGETRLTGWWITAEPASAFSGYTVLYLHGKDGNLGATVDALAALHAMGVNALAFDYRGYGQSQFARPSEAHWRQDTEWALQYLTGTRHIAPGKIVLDGEGLGANLALEVAAAHPELAGVILREPLPDATQIIFRDARAQLVPARLLVRDRYDLDAPAGKLRIPSLWFYQTAAPGSGRSDSEPAAYRKVAPRKMLVWLPEGTGAQKAIADALSRWLANLSDQTR